MTPERAHKLLRPMSITAGDLRIEAQSDKYGGAWVVFATLGNERRPVTQSQSIYGLCEWKRRYEALG